MKQTQWAGALLLAGGLFLMQSGCAAKPSSGTDGKAAPAAKTPPPIASSVPGGAETPSTPGNGQ
jgi:hypothetical protein